MGLGHPDPTLTPSGHSDSRVTGGGGVCVMMQGRQWGSGSAPLFLKLAKKVCSAIWVLEAIVDRPVDTELLVLLDKL